MTVDLVQFLRDRLDEDEQVARAAAEAACGAEWRYDTPYVEAAPEWDMVAVGAQGYLDPETGAHIARHDPARVLREIEAKRRILGRILSHEAVMGSDEIHGAVRRSLALPYAGHPDYRAEWRP